MKTLPEKYYLSHFFELLRFIKTTSWHLLTPAQQQQLAQVQGLTEPALCLLVRIVNRKSRFVQWSQLNYDEIPDRDAALAELKAQQLVSSAASSPLTDLLPELNKAQLQAICVSANVAAMPAASAKKQLWYQCALDHSDAIDTDQHELCQAYLHSDFRALFEYGLFLYFGHLGGTLAQFAMRDLGMLKTMAGSSAPSLNAHFDQLDEAQSGYYYIQQLRLLKQWGEAAKQQAAEELLSEASVIPVGSYASDKFDLLSYKLGVQLFEQDQAQGLALLALSGHASAQEKRIRLLYQQGELSTCQQLLNAILDDGSDEHLVFFAQDFLRLKFSAQRTSMLTDMLRNAAPAIALDEAFVGSPEQGVIDHYQRQGVTAIHGENQIWRALFCLTFWPQLYLDDKSQLSNEFSLLPKTIKDNTFYATFSAEIEARLAQLQTPAAFKAWLVQQVAQHYGKPNGFMFWHDDLLQDLALLVDHAPSQALTNHLRLMSQQYLSVKDGYPDLIGVKDGQLFAQEIKAPGDSLRRNQWIRIQQLSQAGFAISIQPVVWQLDPQQPYVIVDVETTGGHKDYDRITEIAMVKVVAGKVVDTFTSLVNPLRHIPQRITALTGISNQMVADAPEFTQLAQGVDEFSQGAIFVAHNVNFDMGMVKSEFARCGLDYRRAKLCTVVLARKWLPGYDSYSLANICSARGINLQGHHRALNDALATAELFIEINNLRHADSAD
ncbi:exonuclease domain-containing protein [Motilimonas eburnea]|uniref:exonuclease domain-containing protein n=1 Tax=Motilimonas eburnea TaxID=1737488 RepID=UPI001E620A46|nr:exonuclease domain-containing protein [Motilimonas eburnea]MCE2571097.1 VRR-NUC domain-containing protein [Motilimonas eburnea]